MYEHVQYSNYPVTQSFEWQFMQKHYLIARNGWTGSENKELLFSSRCTGMSAIIADKYNQGNAMHRLCFGAQNSVSVPVQRNGGGIL